MKPFILIFLLSGWAVGLRAGPAAPGDAGIPFETAVGISSYALRQAERVEIYEALPREEPAVDFKKNPDAYRQIDGQWVYSAPQDFRSKHISKLQRLVDDAVFQPWREGKTGGGFRADYVIAVPTPKNTIYLLFDFERREARIVREGNAFSADARSPDFRLTVGLSDKGFSEVRSLLTGYHQEPPR